MLSPDLTLVSLKQKLLVFKENTLSSNLTALGHNITGLPRLEVGRHLAAKF